MDQEFLATMKTKNKWLKATFNTMTTSWKNWTNASSFLFSYIWEMQLEALITYTPVHWDRYQGPSLTIHPQGLWTYKLSNRPSELCHFCSASWLLAFRSRFGNTSGLQWHTKFCHQFYNVGPHTYSRHKLAHKLLLATNSGGNKIPMSKPKILFLNQFMIPCRLGQPHTSFISHNSQLFCLHVLVKCFVAFAK